MLCREWTNPSIADPLESTRFESAHSAWPTRGNRWFCASFTRSVGKAPGLRIHSSTIVLLSVVCLTVGGLCGEGENWHQHRGPRQDGVASIPGLPLTWSQSQNLRWKLELPGPGSSSPVVWGDRIFVTAFSGYDLNKRTNENPKDTSEVAFHLICIHAKTGEKLWQKDFKPKHELFPAATSPMSLHGYTTATPAVDGEAVYVSFANGGFYALSHNGKILWESDLGEGKHRWGSGASLVLHEDLVIANADVESQALIAFDRRTGSPVWRQTTGLAQGDKKTWHNGYSWSTPVLIETQQRKELILLTPGKIVSCDPDTGSALWEERTTKGYAMASPIAHQGTVYAIMGSSHCPLTTVAYQAGKLDSGRERELWRLEETGCAVSMPVYVDGLIYWAAFHGGLRPNSAAGFCCLDPVSGKLVYRVRPEEALQNRNDHGIYGCALATKDRIYYVSQTNGTYVVSTGREFKILAHNRIASDNSSFNASPVPLADGGLLLRSDKAIYCVGESR